MNPIQKAISPTQIDENSFTAKGWTFGNGPVFGGLVLAQAISSANATVADESFELHSMHAYFLSPGDTEIPIDYFVDRNKDGRTFTARRVVARQNDRDIFIMAASYHKVEKGFSHQKEMPDVPPPESLVDQREIMKDLAKKYGFEAMDWFKKSPAWQMPFEFKPIVAFDPFQPTKKAPKYAAWMRITEPMDQTPRIQKAMMACFSDYQILLTSLMPHGASFFNGTKLTASIDHAMWFHRPINMNEWVLYCTESPNAHEGLGFNTGSFFDQQGNLLASVSQEGLIRL